MSKVDLDEAGRPRLDSIEQIYEVDSDFIYFILAMEVFIRFH